MIEGLLGVAGMFPGRPVTKQLSFTSLGAGLSHCDIKPAAGEVWIILNAQQYSEDATSRATYWFAHDGTTDNVLFSSAANVAQNVRNHLYADVVSPAPWVVNEAFHISAAKTDVDAGEHVYVHAVVLVIRGVEAWSQT